MKQKKESIEPDNKRRRKKEAVNNFGNKTENKTEEASQTDTSKSF